MEKIKMSTPLVEMDGDEMTRILWAMTKDKLILPFVELKTEYYFLKVLKKAGWTYAAWPGAGLRPSAEGPQKCWRVMGFTRI